MTPAVPGSAVGRRQRGQALAGCWAPPRLWQLAVEANLEQEAEGT